MKDKNKNTQKERDPMRVAHQLVETNYVSREELINRAKFEIQRNFNAFVKNDKPDPNEYKAVGLDGVVFGDFPDKNNYNYVLRFDFQDWENPESMAKDLESTVNNFYELIDSGQVQEGKITIQLVHYM